MWRKSGRVYSDVSGIQAHAGLSNGCRAGHSRSELLLDLGGKGVYSSYTPAPLIPINVDWEFEINVDFSNPAAPRYSISGKHDEFPLYTVHIGDQLIYGFDGVKAGFGPFALAGFMKDIEDVVDEGLLNGVTRPFNNRQIALPIANIIEQSTCNALQ
jgi:hypothetical protein